MIHLNIGSNLNSIHGSRHDNILIATQLLIESKLKINKVTLSLDQISVNQLKILSKSLKPSIWISPIIRPTIFDDSIM